MPPSLIEPRRDAKGFRCASLFCHTGTPVAGAAAGVHNSYDENVISMDPIERRVGKPAMVKTAPGARSYFWPAEGMANDLVKNTQSLGFKRPDHGRIRAIIPVAGLVKFVLDALGEPYFHVGSHERV